MCDNALADAQAVAEGEATAWGKHWMVGEEVDEVKWPDDGEVPLELAEHVLLKAATSFPDHTGLGWGGMHPRVLTRISKPLLRWVVAVLTCCEKAGLWPEEIALVLIALLPKPDGGLRPIGLLPWLPRLWARARREVVAEWEQQTFREYLLCW